MDAEAVAAAKALSQWFTPAPLAHRMAEMALCLAPGETWRVLEPSAGDGALVRAAHAKAPLRAIVTAYDVDPALCERHGWRCADYLSVPAPERRYDLALMNPPYEDGLDAAFIAKSMNESQRVVALVRTSFMHTRARYDSVWSRIGNGGADGWSLVGISYLVSRPSFTLAGSKVGSPSGEYVVIKLRRGELRTTSYVEWW